MNKFTMIMLAAGSLALGACGESSSDAERDANNDAAQANRHAAAREIAEVKREADAKAARDAAEVARLKEQAPPPPAPAP